MASSAKLFYARNDASEELLEQYGDWYYVINDGPKEFSELAFEYGYKAYAVLNLLPLAGGTVVPEMTHHNLDDNLLQALSARAPLTGCSIFQVLSQSCVPFGWQADRNTLSGSSGDDADLKFKDVLLDHGIEGGYCIPVHKLDGARCAVVYFGPRHEEASHFPALVLKTMFVFEGMNRAQSQIRPQAARILSAFEIQCLESIAQGFSFHQLAQKVDLSEHAVRAAFKIIEKKLNARTPAHAIVIAMSKGLMKCPVH